MPRAIAIHCIVTLAVVASGACEKARRSPPKPVPDDAPVRDALDPSDAAKDTHFKIVYAARTDDAPSGSNNTYFSIVEDEAFFVVADAAEPQASKVAAELTSKLIGGDCRDVADDEAQIRCVLDRGAAALAQQHMTASLAIVVVRGPRALLARAGTPAVVHRHGPSLAVYDTPTPPLGAAATSTIALHWVELARGDTIFIVNNRLLDVVGKDTFLPVAPEREGDKALLEDRIAELCDIGRQRRGTNDSLSAIAIHLVHATK